MDGTAPTYRDLWVRIREDLPKKGRGTVEYGGEPKLPVELEGALTSLYQNYEKSYRLWEENLKAHGNGQTPPVFIVVCNNTNVSKMVFDYVAGWEKTARPCRFPANSTCSATSWAGASSTGRTRSSSIPSSSTAARR
jgi:hypothetical protein